MGISPKAKLALKKEEKKPPLQNSKATTRAEGSNTSKTNRPTKTNSTSAQVIRGMRKFTLSSPCLWTSFHPPQTPLLVVSVK